MSDLSEEWMEDEQEDLFYGVPQKVKNLLQKHRKIVTLYEWQQRLLNKLLAEEKSNYIYCVPTSGGKTLVAEILLMREVLVKKRDAILVLPFISIVQEKMRSLNPFAEQMGFMLEEYAGSRGTIPIKKRRNLRTIYVATIEKAHLVVTSLLQADRLSEVGLFVVDELHMVGDGTTRGATLERLIVKTKLAVNQIKSPMRFLGMSATLNNFQDLCDFFKCQLLKDNFRPVLLKEYVKSGNTIFDVTNVGKSGSFDDIKVDRTLTDDFKMEDPENLRLLVGEVIPDRCVLVFCPTRRHCENVAITLSKLLSDDLLKHRFFDKETMINNIKSANDGLICPVLRRTIPYGIAYHHSGLTSDERYIIEGAFHSGIISCICCTSTLAAGVNLPAERVIIREPYIGINFISKAQYQQICGRAGRAGFCSFGESILISNPKDREKIKILLETPIADCMSVLKDVPNGMSSFILTLAHLGLAQDKKEIEEIVLHETLCGIQFPNREVMNKIHESFTQLESLNLMKKETMEVTDVGKGVVRSLIDVTKSLTIYAELKRSLSSLSLSNYVHLIYLTTLLMEEVSLPNNMDKDILSRMYETLTPDEKSSCDTMGISEGKIYKFIQTGMVNVPLRRFYLTLIVYEIWKKRTDLGLLAYRHQIQRGTLHNMVNQMATCAYSLFRFVEEMKMEFWALTKLLPDICEALTYCTIPELFPLLQMPEMRVNRARQLYQAGFKDVLSIASCQSEKELLFKLPLINNAQAKSLLRSARHMVRGIRDELEEKVQAIAELPVDEFNDSAFSVSEFHD